MSNTSKGYHELRVRLIPQQLHDKLDLVSEHLGVPRGSLIKMELNKAMDEHLTKMKEKRGL